jgi:hypothetical protein
MTTRILAVASLLVPTALLTAQTDRITVRMSPAPNQTLHQRTTQVIAMTTEPEPNGTSTPPAAPRTINMALTLETTSTVGAMDSQGHYQTRVVCESASTTATLNGRPMPIPPLATEKIVGQAFTFSYDDQGKVIDVDADGALAGTAVAPLKQMLTSVLPTAAPITLSVGETVTVPAQFTLPLSSTGPGGTGSAITMTVERGYTLTSIAFEGAERIAHLATKMIGAMNGLPAVGAGPGPTMAVDTRVTSEGTSDVNVDRGIVLHNEQRVSIDTLTGAEASAGRPNIRMHGTITITTDLVRY